ncbi:RNase H domain-containing protein [Trichonephila clavipes]|uniref:RNase H domain-containing protein n=1 Tax=Trichonephila clavipes TaxID=2585209 RepID=A0A8X6RWB8_TRICX|nr:RNase H domain-containing protein [Trichonephila clavipes]
MAFTDRDLNPCSLSFKLPMQLAGSDSNEILSWKIGRLPAEWKRATIIPIKKAGKNNWAPKDFRPIALTSTTCKIMEKMILIRIQYFLDSKNLIPDE